jgi:membrane protease YdiL (CAAX protease family)
MSLSLPLVRFPVVTWYALTALPLLTSAYLTKNVLSLRGQDIGLSIGRWYIQILIAIPGIIFGVAEYLILRPEPIIHELTLNEAWFPALTLLIATGFAEEFIFRGVLQKVSMDALGRWGLFLVAIIFAVLHVGYLSVLDVVFVFLVGLYFAWVTLKTGSILGATLAHGLTNILLFLVIPFVGLGPLASSAAPTSLPAVLPTKAQTTVTPAEATPVPTLATPSVTAEPSYVRPEGTPTSDIWSAPFPNPVSPAPWAQVSDSPVRLSWEWHRPLAEGEFYEVRVWLATDMELVESAVVSETYWDLDITAYPPGEYLWGIRAVQGHRDGERIVIDAPVSIIGTLWAIQW